MLYPINRMLHIPFKPHVLYVISIPVIIFILNIAVIYFNMCNASFLALNDFHYHCYPI